MPTGKVALPAPRKMVSTRAHSHAPFTYASRTNRKGSSQPFVRNPEVDVSHGSRLWPCGSCRRRGEIVGAGSLGMVRPRGSSPSVQSRPGGEVEFPGVPRGTTPPHKIWGPAPVSPRKICACVNAIGREAGLRRYACAKVACLRWAENCPGGVGPGSLTTGLRASEPDREVGAVV